LNRHGAALWGGFFIEGKRSEQLIPAPQQLGRVFPECAIGSQNHQILDQGLRYEHPVKGVGVVDRKIVNFHRVTVIDKERAKALLGHESRNMLHGRSGKI
jgi:hypothetical protein